jgi:ABC-type xylose transport system substrate-binding protein
MAETMDVKLARLEEQMKTIFKQNETLTEEVRELVAAMNRGKGAFGFAMVLAGAMGAAAVKLMGVFIGRM